MIDLHTHTNNSDGTKTPLELLKEANDKNLEVLSITDHNTCKSYEDLENINISEVYKGKIIVGCEFTSTFDERLIEILGYGFNYKDVQKYLNQRYDEKIGTKNVQILFNRLKDLFDKYNIKYNPDNLHYPKKDNDFFEKSFYDEFMKYPQNKEIIKEDIFNSFSDFFRKGLTNPKSKMYIRAVEFKPSVKEIIDVIHKSDGKAFLAHPFQYKFNDTEEFLNKLYDKNAFDGIECFYTTFSKEQSAYLVEFAKKRKLLISGGSDYHGTNKVNHELGIGNNNLNIDKKIIENWEINYFN